MMYEEATMAQDRAATAVDQLDQEMERLDRLISLLRERLAFVLQIEGPEKILTQPADPSMSPLQGRALRLSDLNMELDRIIMRLHI